METMSKKKTDTEEYDFSRHPRISRYLTATEVAEQLNIDPSTLWRMWNAGLFPRPVRLLGSKGTKGKKRKGWRWSEASIAAWQAEKDAKAQAG